MRIDGHKLEFHPRRVAEWAESGDDWERARTVYPIYVEVSPVGACNHRCTFCAVDYIGYQPVILDHNLLLDRLHEMYDLGVKSVMYAGEGEPLLHKKIDHIVELTPQDMAFTTNGVLLDRLDSIALCKWVKVSLNAGTEETYNRVHRAKSGDWAKVWANLKDAAKRKGSCTLGVQMVVLPENEHEAPLLQQMCEDIGVDYVVFKPYSQHRFSITRQYDGYKPVKLPEGRKTVVRKDAIATTAHAYDRCNATPFFWAYVMATGDVYSCSAYLKDERFMLGNLNAETFQGIWEGPKRKANWQFVRNELDIRECRVNCRMDKANRYLAEFETLPHINFI